MLTYDWRIKLMLRDVNKSELDDDFKLEEELTSSQEVLEGRSDDDDLIIPRCEFLTGCAGTGKTYEIKRRNNDYRRSNPSSSRVYSVVCATTGIAAINLGDGTSTINS